MLVKIPIQDLEVGMYVARTGLSWADHPELYSVEGLITYEDELEAIIRDGFKEAVVDTERGTVSFGDLGREDPSSALAGRPVKARPVHPLREELRAAKGLQREALIFVKDFARNLSMGRSPDLDASEDMVSRMIESVGRNSDAMLGLAKLRSTDEYTFNHCLNVTVLAVVFGRHLQLDPEKLLRLGQAGLFHDMGKFDVPMEVLNKPGKLTDEEFRIMQDHPVFGYRRLKAVPGVDAAILPAVLHHHERYDGKGNPKGLTGAEMDQLAEIIAVADVYDALTSRRVYKSAMQPAKAMSLIFSMRDQNFDPDLLEKFVCCLGVYPMGSYVRLSDGRYGVVRESPAENATLPVVRILRDANGNGIAPTDVNLAQGGGLTVEASLDPAEHCVDPFFAILN